MADTEDSIRLADPEDSITLDRDENATVRDAMRIAFEVLDSLTRTPYLPLDEYRSLKDKVVKTNAVWQRFCDMKNGET